MVGALTKSHAWACVSVVIARYCLTCLCFK